MDLCFLIFYAIVVELLLPPKVVLDPFSKDFKDSFKHFQGMFLNISIFLSPCFFPNWFLIGNNYLPDGIQENGSHLIFRSWVDSHPHKVYAPWNHLMFPFTCSSPGYVHELQISQKLTVFLIVYITLISYVCKWCITRRLLWHTGSCHPLFISVQNA